MPIFFLVIMTFLVVFPLFYNAVECLVGLAIIATGLPVYVILVSWNNKPLVYRRFVGWCSHRCQFVVLSLLSLSTGVGKLFGVEGRMSPQGTCYGPDR